MHWREKLTFNENDHPRDKDGKFTDGSQESSADRINRIQEKHFPHLTEEREGVRISLQFFAEKESDIKRQSSNSIKRSIRKLKKRIFEHQDKISNPERYSEDWSKLSVERKEKRLEYWRTEIAEFEKSIQRRIDELEKRGENDDE